MATKAKSKDDIVQDLIDVVAKKKQEIAKAEKPKWETNCSYILDGERINIQTVTSISKLVEIAADVDSKSNNFKTIAILMNVDEEYKKDGFTAKQWISDLNTRIFKIQLAKKKEELEDAEKRLNKLISPEKREEMELEALTKLLAK